MTIDLEAAIASAMDEYEARFEPIPGDMHALIADEALQTITDWYDYHGTIRTDYLEIVSDLVTLYKEE